MQPITNNPATRVHIHSPATVAIVVQYDGLLQRYARRLTGDETLAALIVPEAFRCYEKSHSSQTGRELRKVLQAETWALCQQRIKQQRLTTSTAQQYHPINL